MSKGFGKGRSPTKFSFTYEDIAQIMGCTPEAARKHAQRGNFDPTDLISVLEFVRDRLRTTQDGEDLQESDTGLPEIAPGAAPRRLIRKTSTPKPTP